MKQFLILAIVVFAVAINEASASGAAIASAARSQIGVPYSWGGGGIHGKSRGTGSGANTIGFDCSGLAQYSVYKGTNKVIARTAAAQYNDGHCRHVPYAQHQPGDLVFFGNPIHHVGIIVSHGRMVDAPHTGVNVREEAVWNDHVGNVARCF